MAKIVVMDWELEKAREYVARKNLPMTAVELIAECRKLSKGFAEVVEHYQRKAVELAQYEQQHNAAGDTGAEGSAPGANVGQGDGPVGKPAEVA